ncbi:MAG: pyruvate, phosphate dikinase [Actinomycetota bacterium]|nr:pyruvate, phosphate dikinase [Ilumatobacteraceae bacterium]MDA2958966.1 pyruvate, phosphate dikinase [Actinomycetota bacterium]MDA3006511.1 pyruvate, phosphate dikinase [Actinomycetota bacterium]MDA3033899.1 pyruvate, phosphate dikinase [Actinomycetota bacterium]
MPYVYAFDHSHRKPPMSYKDLLGGKGANLAEMTTVLGLPVPPGFTVSTDACRAYMHDGWPAGLDDEITRHVRKLERTMGRRLGDADDPLLVSVRSGAKFSMPGMMDTVLNLGLNDQSVKGLAAVTGDERFAYDSYRRFIAMYGRIVMGVEGEVFEAPLEAAKEAAGTSNDADLDAATLKKLATKYLSAAKRHAGVAFPQDPREQLNGAIEAVFRSWNGARAVAYRVREKISHDLGTAVNVQTMVFGNRDDTSGTGVGFTRNAATGDNRPYGDFLVNAQGEDVVAGIRNTQTLDDMAQIFPSIHAELLNIFVRLEEHYHDMCDTEFTIEQGRLWMLQTRVGKRTGAAALKMAVDMTKGTKGSGGSKWTISREEAVMRVTADHLDSVLHPQFRTRTAAIAKGLGASPGAAVGRVYFTADEAESAARRGEAVVLVRNETSPEDVHGMMVAEGILTARGGLVSHAAVVARGWGTPAVVGADAVRIDGREFRVGSTVVRQGDVISLDGTTGEVMLGALELSAAEPPAEYHTILSWADRIRKGKMAVRANADTGADATVARSNGAEGIGLCRTEHMFLAPDRLPIVREMILADTPRKEAAALEKLRAAQQADFEDILLAMDGLPVTVRLLDPPLHEFLPSVEELKVKQARRGLSARDTKLLAAAESWAEHNPMIGTRGVRLGVIKPGLYAMQVRALLDAAAMLRDAGKNPIVEIMIPLTVTREELALARSWVQEEIDRALAGMRRKPKITIGTMIETPRAAVRADEIAEAADFFSFGTNDLTQLTFGFSRDDVESRMMPAYLEQGLLKRNPFDTIDQSGVGDLVALGAERGRSTRADLKLGVCGEHGGDPESIDLFWRVGLDYVSCSPFRVPIARLAAAQAIITNG